MPKLKYKCDWSKIREKARSQHQQEYGLSSVRDAVMKAVAQGKMENPYRKYEELQKEQVTETKLHAAHGAKLQEQGGHVLEFDLAGSGYKQFQSIHAGLDGENHYYRNGVSIPFDDIDEGTKWEVHWWNRLPAFLRSALGLMGEEEIRTQNEAVDQLVQSGKNSDARSLVRSDTAPKAKPEKRSEALIRQKFGEHPKLKALRDKKYIYVKDRTVEEPDHTKIYRMRYSMPGSQSTILGCWNGARNKGEYSIQKINEYMLTAGKDYLKNIFKEWDKKKNPANNDPSDTVTIMLKGHSRGGVSAVQGAMMLKYWIKNYYPRYENRIRFKLLQLDPVAGFGSDHGLKRRVNVAREERKELRQELAERRMEPLGDSGDATVVYSLHTDHRYFFAPQSVDGAKRIILTATNHGVNLGTVDESQKAYGDTKAHREGYLDLATGEMYRGSGLHELPEGIYIADENNRLIRVPNLEVGRSIINDVLEHTSGQEKRHERIVEVMKNWFEAHNREKVPDFVPKDKLVPSVKKENGKEKNNTAEQKRTESMNNGMQKQSKK